MMFAVLTAVVTADTKEQLDSYTDALFTIGRKRLCQFATLKYQQLDGLNTVLPYGVRRIDALRTLTTESAAVFMPFRVQEVFDKSGIYCGKNAISGNMIVVNKSNLMNGSSLRFGIPGSGKSFGCKDEMEQIALNTGDDILVCDPEREYSSMDCSGLVRAAYRDCGLSSMSGLSSTGMAQKCRGMNVLFTDPSQLQAGDLIFFARKDASRGTGYCTDHRRCGSGRCKRWMQIHHVAIYINGEFLIDSTGGSNSVQIRKHWGKNGSEWEWVCFGRPTT